MAERTRVVAGSVRARVTALAAVVVFVVLGLAGVALVIAQYELRLRDIDDSLRLRADDLEAFVAAGDAGARTLPFSADTVAQIVDGSGRVVATSHPSASDAALAPPPAAPETIATRDGLAIDDDEFRVLSRRSGGLVIHVARAIDDAQDARRALTGALAVAVPLVTVVLAAGVWVLVGRTLRPVEAIRAEVAGMRGDEPHRRVPVPHGRDEIARLARTVNEMLERVEDAQIRQRRFAADASHELRSPLTRMRTELEVDLAHPEGADPRATHDSVLEEVDVLQRTIDDLLVLARGDEGSPLRTAPVDLDDVVGREAGALRTRGDLTVDLGGVSGAQVMGDEPAIARAVRNLLDNAARHARRRVEVTLHEERSGDEGGDAVLTVTDDGPGIPPGERERVFERFTRLDEARSRGGGTGLGLPIARSVAEAHGGSLTVGAGPAGGARFELRLPLSRA